MIDLEATEGVAWIRLDRPEALNALNAALTEELEQMVERVAIMERVSVLVVTGRGRAFCAGNDVAEMAMLVPEAAEALARRQGTLMERFATLPQVTIAAIDGYALGGGLMLALAQDLRIASDRARLGLPEVTLGFNPAYGIARLLDVVGGGPGRDLLLTGRTIHAAEALKMGLVNRVVAAPTLEASAVAWAAEITKLPRAGLATTKEVVRRVRHGEPGGEAAAWAATLGTPEARQRVAAFAERRKR